MNDLCIFLRILMTALILFFDWNLSYLCTKSIMFNIMIFLMYLSFASFCSFFFWDDNLLFPKILCFGFLYDGKGIFGFKSEPDLSKFPLDAEPDYEPILGTCLYSSITFKSLLLPPELAPLVGAFKIRLE